MSSGKHVGRVGALAVALGVGMAIAGNAGVAAADAGVSESSNASNSEADSPSRTTKASRSGERGASNESADDSGEGASDAGDDDNESAPEAADDEPEAADDKSSAIVEDEVGNDTVVDDNVVDDTVVAEPEVEIDEPSERADVEVIETVDQQPEVPAASEANGVESVTVTTVVGESSSATAATPAEPARTPILTALLFWFRREIEYGFLNQRPVVRPVQIIADATGSRVVQGTMNATGPNAKLTYEIVEQPLNGRVTIDANGMWTYIPSPGFSADGGTETFAVKVTDKAFHLASLFGVRNYSKTVSMSASVRKLELTSPGMLNYIQVTNFTQSALTVQYGPQPPNFVFPIYGTVFQPGETLVFITQDQENLQSSNVTFTGANGLSFDVYFFDQGGGADDNYKHEQCFGSGGGTCSNWIENGQTMVLLDTPGTSVTIPAANADLVNTILNNICSLDDASCTFKATSVNAGYTGAHVPSGFADIRNDTQDNMTTTFTWSDALAASSSWSVSAKASGKIFDIVTAEISAQYGQSVTATHTFSQAATATIRPGYQVEMAVQDPVWSYTGDFTVSVGNTTWYLPGATLDVPNPDGTAVATVTTVPIAAQTTAVAV